MNEIPVGQQSTGLVWNGEDALVSGYTSGMIVKVDFVKGQVIRQIPVGHGPLGLAKADHKKLLVVCNSNGNDVSVVDLETGKEKGRVPVVRQPSFVAVTLDESLAVVSNQLPLGDSTNSQTAASVSLIDLDGLKNVGNIRLPPGSCNCHGVTISSDGHWAYVVHTIGRTQQPTTEVEGGWINVNALTILDLTAKTVAATVYLDRITEGAADPWGIALSADQKTLWITLSGTHQLVRLDLAGLFDFLKGKPVQVKLATPTNYSQTTPTTDQPSNQFFRERLVAAMDMTSLYLTGLIKRIPLPGKGPRGLALSPDGKTVAVAMYYSGEVVLVDAATDKVTASIPLGAPREMDKVRRGEMIFHDASCCLQHWFSCATCHPDGRADGLNWDLPNDGIGNPKNTRSLVMAHKTKPMMSLGVRANLKAAVEAGFRSIQFHEPTKEEVECVVAYLQSLQPEPSPHLMPDGQLSPSAKRGRELFIGKAGCASCHPEPVFSDSSMHDVGTTRGMDKGKKLKTTALVELWRTAPYLNDGRAVTLKDVLTKFNLQDQHGNTSKLSPAELDDLVQYLLSL